MAIAAGLALAAISLIDPTIKLLDFTITFVHDARHSSKAASENGLKLSELKNRYDSLQKVLFQEEKFPFVKGRLFDALPVKTQRLGLQMFRELPQLLYEYNAVEASYQSRQTSSKQSDSSTGDILSLDELQIIFEKEDANQELVTTPEIRVGRWRSLMWSARGKKRSERLIAQVEDWLTRIKNLLEDVWWPLPFFEYSINLQALESDSDVQAVGLAESVGLRKLLVNDAKLPSQMKLETPQLAVTRFDGACRGLSDYKGEAVLVEYAPYTPNSDGFLPGLLRRRFAELACLLNQQKDSRFRALHCLGYVDSTFPRLEFQLLFQLPIVSLKPPAHLLSLYTSKQAQKPSLGARFQLCFQLAQSMSLFHSVNWIHKSFRSTNVLFSPSSSDTDCSLGIEFTSPFVVGFEASRLANDFSSGPYDNLLSQNVYRHPDRWGIPNKTFTKYHDIYALGIVLLEIGLWEPAETMGGNNFQAVKQIPTAISGALLKQAERRLAHRCGDKFREVVVRCLKGNFGIAPEMDDRLDSELQEKFRKCVLENLKELATVV